MEKENAVIKNVNVRFPPELLSELKRLAKHNNRSLNGEIINTLENRLRETFDALGGKYPWDMPKRGAEAGKEEEKETDS